MFYVYLLQSKKDKTFYTGYTTNLKRRIQDHQSGNGSRTTSLKSDWKLIYFEGYLNEKDALGREKFLKGGSGHVYIKKQLKNYFNKEKKYLP